MSKKILIVEDEEIIYSLLQKKLSQEGYEVRVAKDGQEGIDKMKEQKPDLVLMDIIMPRKSGFEVMEEMQKDEELRTVPIVVISNSGQPVELDRAKELGAIDWLVKTEFDPQEVIEKVRKHI